MISRERKVKRLIELYKKWVSIVEEVADEDSDPGFAVPYGGGPCSFFEFHNRVLMAVIETFPRNKNQIEQMIFVSMEYLKEHIENRDCNHNWADNFKDEYTRFRVSLSCYGE